MDNKFHLSAIRDFFALERNIIVLLGALLIIGMGEELWVRYMPKYLEALGASAVAIGAFGSFKRVVDTLYQYPGGWLADRIGRNRALILFNLTAALGYLLYLLTNHWELIILGTLLVLAWSSMSQPAIFALIGDTLSQSRRAMGFSVQSIWKRIPIVIAPPLGGYLLSHFGLISGMHIGFAFSMGFALSAIIFQRRFYRHAPLIVERQKASMTSIWSKMPASLRRLLFADCLVRFGSNVVVVYVILFVVNVRGKSPLEFGALTSLQMITSIVVYLPAARLADRLSRQPFILGTFLFFTLFPLFLIGLPPAWLFIAFIIGGLREMGEPARKARIVDLAHESYRGRVVGLYYLIRGLITIPASLLGGILWQSNYALPFVLGSLVSGLGLAVYAISPRISE
jgi:MFS family permease